MFYFIPDEDRNEIIARLTEAIVLWFLDHYNITDNDVDSVPKAAIWDKARVYLPVELGKKVFFNQLMKGLKARGERIRIKSSMVMRVKMRENLQTIQEEEPAFMEESIEPETTAEPVQEEVHGEAKEEDKENLDLKSASLCMSQVELDLKRKLGMKIDDTGNRSALHLASTSGAAGPRRKSMDAQVQADIEEAKIVNKNVTRVRSAGSVGASPRSNSMSSLEVKDSATPTLAWRQVQTSTPALKTKEGNKMHPDLTPIMSPSSKIVKKRRTVSQEARTSRGGGGGSRSNSTGSQGRPQRPPRLSRRASRESRKSRTTSYNNIDDSTEDSYSSGVFSDPPALEKSLSDTEVIRQSYGTHNMAGFFST